MNTAEIVIQFITAPLLFYCITKINKTWASNKYTEFGLQLFAATITDIIISVTVALVINHQAEFPGYYILLFVSLFLVLYSLNLIRNYTVSELRSNNLNIAKEHAEIEALKLQVDAHFLFNSLNTLHYLAEKDTRNMKVFIEKLAEVYRYILNNKSNEFVFLREELNFSQNYFYLLKERFGDSLKLRIQIHNVLTEDFLIIPISIQLLIENAIKHNKHSEADPLEINIEVDNDQLTVRNNKSALSNNFESTNLGLRNLNERSEIILGKKITVHDNGSHFSVSLPIKKLFI